MKIGVMFGNPETTTGGNALKFYSSVRLEVRRIEAITDGPDNPIGNRVRVKVVKNKVAPPFKKVELEIIFGRGISRSGSLLEAAVHYDIIKKSGSWYSFEATKIGQGREAAKKYLEADEKIYNRVSELVKKKILLASDDGTNDTANRSEVRENSEETIPE